MKSKLFEKINNIICILVLFFIILSVALNVQEIVKSSFFSYLINIIIMLECYYFFQQLEKIYKKETDKIILLSNAISEFKYENLKNIKKINILNSENISVLLKDSNNTLLTFNLSSAPQTQQELIEFDSNILIKNSNLPTNS